MLFRGVGRGERGALAESAARTPAPVPAGKVSGDAGTAAATTIAEATPIVMTDVEHQLVFLSG